MLNRPPATPTGSRMVAPTPSWPLLSCPPNVPTALLGSAPAAGATPMRLTFGTNGKLIASL